MRSYILLLFTISIFGSCRAQSNTTIHENEINFTYPETILPQDTTKLWMAEGDPTKEIVTIFLQGGPKDDLDFETRGKSSWRYLPDYTDYYSIHLHQANTLNPGMFTSDGDFTVEMARKEVDNTSEILFRAIKYFKDKGKTVYVMGHSYGAFVIPHYLATRPSLADKYVLISGRIDDPVNVVEAHKKGFNGIYKEGVNFVSDQGNEDFSEYNKWAMKYYKGKQYIKAAIGELSYSIALNDVDLSHTIYIYNPKDERVGGLSNSELEFLISKKVQVFSSEWEHGYTIRELVDLVKAGKIEL